MAALNGGDPNHLLTGMILQVGGENGVVRKLVYNPYAPCMGLSQEPLYKSWDDSPRYRSQSVVISMQSLAFQTYRERSKLGKQKKSETWCARTLNKLFDGPSYLYRHKRNFL